MVMSREMARVQSLSVLDSTKQLEIEGIRDRIQCLLRQEEDYYLCADYFTKEDEVYSNQHAMEQCVRVVTDLSFSPLWESSMQDDAAALMQNSFPSSVCVKDLANTQADPVPNSKSSFVRDGRSTDTNLVGRWRAQMLDWSRLVIDSFGIDREVVAMAFNLLDRYVAREANSQIPITREDFQLFCMTSLFVAVKMLGTYPRKLTAEALVGMSRGFYACEDILHTERELLRTLGWHLSPTTVLGWCRLYWELFPIPISAEFETACHIMSEMALADTFFLTRKPSLIGLAAVLLAAKMEGLEGSVTQQFLSELEGGGGVQFNQEVDAVYQRLELLCSR